MRLKYYLRGAGFGMVFTALILVISMKVLGYGKITDTSDQTALNESILGEKQQSVMADGDGSDKTSPSVTEIVQNNQDSLSDSSDDLNNATQEPDSSLADSSVEAPSASETPSEPALPGSDVAFTITGGQYSDVVSKNLQSAGLIEDATDFNDYICDKGYDKNLQPGNYIIPVGASYEDIARILTKK